MPKLPDKPEPTPPKLCIREGCDEPVEPMYGRLCLGHFKESLDKLERMSEEAGKDIVVGRKPTAREQLAIDRARAEAASEARFAEARLGYPASVNSARETYVRRESEKAVKEIQDRQLQAVPDADRAEQRRRMSR